MAEDSPPSPNLRLSPSFMTADDKRLAARRRFLAHSTAGGTGLLIITLWHRRAFAAPRENVGPHANRIGRKQRIPDAGTTEPAPPCTTAGPVPVEEPVTSPRVKGRKSLSNEARDRNTAVERQPDVQERVSRLDGRSKVRRGDRSGTATATAESPIQPSCPGG